MRNLKIFISRESLTLGQQIAVARILSAIESLRSLILANVNETKLLREELEKFKTKYKNFSDASEVVSCVQILDLPCDTLDDLILFEAKIQDDMPSFRALQNLLDKMPHLTLKKYLSGCLKYCMTDTVANQCTWEGYNNNLAVGDFTLSSVIMECARKKFPEARSADIAMIMRKWFHYAKDRVRRLALKNPLPLTLTQEDKYLK